MDFFSFSFAKDLPSPPTQVTTQTLKHLDCFPARPGPIPKSLNSLKSAFAPPSAPPFCLQTTGFDFCPLTTSFSTSPQLPPLVVSAYVLACLSAPQCETFLITLTYQNGLRFLEYKYPIFLSDCSEYSFPKFLHWLLFFSLSLEISVAIS